MGTRSQEAPEVETDDQAAKSGVEGMAVVASLGQQVYLAIAAAGAVHGGFIWIMIGFWGCNQRKGREL